MFRLMLASVLAAVVGLQAATAAPLEAYGGLPNIETIDISPDGEMLAVVVTTGEDRLLRIKKLSDGSEQAYGVGDAKVRRLDWVGAEHLIISTSQTSRIAGVIAPRREHMLGFDLNVATGKIRPLLGQSTVRQQTGTHIRDRKSESYGAALNVMAGPPEVRRVDGGTAVFLKGITFPNRWGVLTVFSYDPRTGETRPVEVGDPDTRQILLAQDGVPAAKTTYDDDSGRWALKLRSDGGWREIRSEHAPTESPYVLGLGRDGRSVVVVEQGDLGAIVREVSPEGTWSEPLDVRDADGPIFDPDSHRLIGLYALVGDENRYTFFDPADQKAWDSVRAAFKGDRVRLESWSRDRKKIILRVDSATEGQGYAFVDMTVRKGHWLGARYQKLLPADIGPVRPVRFKAADGLELGGYLTLPNGAEAKNLPLVVLPHGGPASRDTPDFDWWAQAVASRGYAVLQVNFRGSDGFGWNFLQAGFGEWGRKMQTDLSDGVRHLAAEGVIDPARVCIVGGSYGGYAALAGAALDTGVYRCAVSFAGVSDLRRFVQWSKNQNGDAALRYWTRFMGAEAARDPALTEISPAAHADKVTIPVLLIHGRDDTVVPLEQSQIMAEALERAGKPYELVVQKGEDHWLSRGETRLEMLQATMAFVEEHNPPD